MSYELKLDVRQNHIVEGTANDPCYCPIALCIREAMRKGQIDWIKPSAFKDVFVDGTEVQINTMDGESLIADLNTKEVDFIELFDNGEDVEPFTDTLTFKGPF